MDIKEIWFSGKLKDISNLEKDLKKFPKDTFNNQSFNTEIIQSPYEKGYVGITNCDVKDLIAKEWKGNFNDFKKDPKDNTTTFEYENKTYHIYQNQEIRNKRYQKDVLDSMQ